MRRGVFAAELCNGMNERNIAVIGAGPAGMMAAEVAAAAGARVTIYDRMASPGRKMLLAGRGGLNLTHSEPAEIFRTRYGEAATDLEPALDAFGPLALRAWCGDLGIDTFVGSSGRVFPVPFKTSPLLRAWLRRLDGAGVRLVPRHRWLGWSEAGRLRFAAPSGEVIVAADATVMALGGATWPQLGAGGSWVPVVDAAGVATEPLRPANCGFVVAWSDPFLARFEGRPLKNIAVEAAGVRACGDVVVTRAGVEGSPIYALSASLRETISRNGTVTFHVALRPDLDHAALAARLAKRKPKESFANGLRKALGLAPAAVALLREAERPGLLPVQALDAGSLAALINAVPLRATAPMPMAGAISTAGGIRFDALDADLMLRVRPGTFVAGEMLDWEAPTGGYLLQGLLRHRPRRRRVGGGVAGERAHGLKPDQTCLCKASMIAKITKSTKPPKKTTLRSGVRSTVSPWLTCSAV